MKGRAAKKPVAAKVNRKKARHGKARVIKASYDAALPADLDEDHWYWADSLNANAANSRDVRKTLRERAQYEADNNGYCGGLVDRLGNDLVGTGPRPQLRIPGATRDVVRSVEVSFLAWSRRVHLPLKLRLLDNGATVRGEGFGLLATNPALPAGSVQLDLRLYETDQVETPWYDYGDPLSFDGGRLDDFGNVTEWHFLKAHPGSDVWGYSSLDYDPIPAGRVVHWYKPRRAGQIRGVPEILSALTLYAYLRRYTLATVCAAETAANMAGLLTTASVNPDPSEDPAANGIESMDKVPIPRGSLLTLPAGWNATQMKAEQPTNTYAGFKGELLTETGASVGAPRNVATNSSAEYNYSSGRLDRGIYEGGIRVRRGDLRSRVLDPLFRAWLREALLIPGLIPAGLGDPETWSWDWFYDAFPSVDPAKDATLNDLCVRNGTKTYAQIYAEAGLDWEEQFEQRGREQTRLTELKIPPLAPAPAPAPDATPPPPDQQQVDSATDAAAVAGEAKAAGLKAYDENQPRADNGEFGEGSGSGGGGSEPAKSGGGNPGGGPAGNTASTPAATADHGHGAGRDASGAKTDAPAGQRYRVVDKTTTHEGVKSDHAKNLTTGEAHDALSWHDGMTQVGTNGPNPRLPDASRPPLNDFERGALQKYTYKNDRVLNADLRGVPGAIDASPYGPTFYAEMNKGMQSAFDKAPVMAKPITVVRGMNLDNEKLSAFVANLEKSKSAGSPIAFAGFTSTAAPGGLAYKMGLADATASIPKSFQGNVALKINAVHGLDMSPHSQLPGEHEFLMNHDSKFTVKSVTQKNGKYTVELDQIPPKSKPAKASAPPVRVSAADQSNDDAALLKLYENDAAAAGKWVDTNADFIRFA